MHNLFRKLWKVASSQARRNDRCCQDIDLEVASSRAPRDDPALCVHLQRAKALFCEVVEEGML